MTPKPVYHYLFDSRNHFHVAVEWMRGPVTRTFPLAYHREVEFQYIKRGAGTYWIQGRVYPFKPHSFFVIRPNVIHRFLPRPKSFIEKGAVVFAGALVRELCPGRGFFDDLPTQLVLREKETGPMEVLINWIESEYKAQSPYWRELIRADLCQLVLRLKRLSRYDQPPRPEHPLISRVVGYLEAYYAQPVTLTLLAARFAHSPYDLCRLFKQQTGLGIKQYLLQRRIIAAKQILDQNPDVKITSLPTRVGFASFNVFNRDFKLHTGMTPATYRKISHPLRK